MNNSPQASTLLYGTICGLCSAVGYTAANGFLRAVADCDPIWVSAMKAFPTILFVGPWIAVQAWRGRWVWPSAKVLGVLIFGAVVAQLFGNVLFQYALGIIGMALTVPLCLGTIILAGAILGRLLLGEALTVRTLVSITVLILAIVVLSLGAQDAQRSVAASLDTESLDTESPSVASATGEWWSMAAGVSAALFSGLAYATLGIVIRYGVTGRASLACTLFVVGIVGVISLGAASLIRVGWEGILETRGDDFLIMLLAGLCNFLAFVAITKAFQLATVVYVNALNATQATMAAAAGVIFFHEALSPELAMGTILTMFGLWWMREDQR